MYIRRIYIENIKCFKKAGDHVSLELQRPDGSYAGWTVVAGRNGTGKSTFLRAIALAIAGPKVARSLQESFLGWIRYGEPKGFVSTELFYGEEDKLKIDIKPGFGTLSTGLMWDYLVYKEQDREPDIHAMVDSIELTTPALAENGPWASNPEGWFIAGYGCFRRLPGHGIEAQRLKNGPRRITQLVSLFREDAPLVESITWLKEVYLRRLEKQPGTRELEKGVLALLDDGLLPGGMKIKKVDSNGLWVTHNGQTLALTDLSDGYRTIAALVLDLARQMFNCYGEFKVRKQNSIYQVNYPGVVLIDEIDAHMHISWQQEIGYWLKRHFPAIQFIVTTHSPFICQAADPKGLIRLPAPGENRKAEHVPEKLFNIVKHGSADEAVLTELFGLETPHSQYSEEIRDEVAKLEVLIINDRATPAQKKRYEKLTSQLPDTQSYIAIKKVPGKCHILS